MFFGVPRIGEAGELPILRYFAEFCGWEGMSVGKGEILATSPKKLCDENHVLDSSCNYAIYHAL